MNEYRYFRRGRARRECLYRSTSGPIPLGEADPCRFAIAGSDHSARVHFQGPVRTIRFFNRRVELDPDLAPRTGEALGLCFRIDNVRATRTFYGAPWRVVP
jgi:hypothetical protein